MRGPLGGPLNRMWKRYAPGQAPKSDTLSPEVAKADEEVRLEEMRAELRVRCPGISPADLEELLEIS